MKPQLPALLAFGLFSACGSTNPFMVTADDGSTEQVETQDPSTNNSKYLFDTAKGLTMNSVEYDATNDELVINNLPFDGPDGRYDHIRNQGGAGVYQSRRTATTGQIDHYAVFINNAAMQATAAAGEDWGDYGYGGANLVRQNFSLPGGVGEYVYLGDYAGVRTLSDRSGLQIVTGDARLLLDILDFDNDGVLEGAIAGTITNRNRTWANGTAMVGLPDVILATVSFDPDTGSFVEGEATTYTPTGNVRDKGAYEGMIGGATGTTMGAMVLLDGQAEVQEVFYEVIEWNDPVSGTSGTVAGYNADNRDAIATQVDLGVAIPYQSADRTGIPATATITSSTESTVITGDGTAQEIGVLVADQI